MSRRVITGIFVAALFPPLGLAAEAHAQSPMHLPTAATHLPAAAPHSTPDPIVPVDPQTGFAPGGVDPLDIGQGTAPTVPPSRQPKLLRSGQAPVVGVMPFQFRTSGVQPRIPAAQLQPWRDVVATRVDSAPHDDQGVRKYAVGTTLYDHPVGQAQWGLANLNTFRRTGDAFFLARAQANADRLIQTATDADGAKYFGYPFDFSSPSHHFLLKAPWYSGMAQGEALSLFVQLAQTGKVTADQRAAYRSAADQTFLSFLRGPDRQPWVVHPDKDGYLWLEEYPQDPNTTSDFTLNGHMFATLGLWDYYTLTQLAPARTLLDGAITTIQRYAPQLRTAGWVSRYCVPHEVRAERYHYIHDFLALQLSWLTGKASLAGLSDDLHTDFPKTDLSGTVQFGGGTHYAYKFSGTGAVTATRKLVLARSSSAPTTKRTRIKGRGVYYLITAGGLSGYYVGERPSQAFLRGQRLLSPYDPARAATFAAGSYTARRFNTTTGAVTSSRTLRLSRASSAPVNARALINGAYWVRVSAGSLAGFWLPASSLKLAR